MNQRIVFSFSLSLLRYRLLLLLRIKLCPFTSSDSSSSISRFLSLTKARMDPSTDSFQPPVVPRDSEGYVKSFDITNDTDAEAAAARAFFDEYGFVVFANVFTSEQCMTTITDIWDVIDSFVKKPVRNDEKLWTPQYAYFLSPCPDSILSSVDFGSERGWSPKVLLVMRVYGHGRFSSTDRFPLYMLHSPASSAQRISSSTMIGTECFDRRKTTQDVRR